MSAEPLNATLDAQVVACPRCNAELSFCRSRTPLFDACGFECYSLECEECGASLGGVVDPSDEALLLAVTTS